MRTLLAALLALAVLAPASALVPAPEDPLPLAAPAADDAPARAATRALPRATAVNDGDGDKLWDTLEARYALGGAREVGVVVTFVEGTDPAQGLARARAAAGPFDVARAFRIVPGFAASLGLGQAMRIAALPEVRQLEWNAPGQAELDTATVFFGADHVADDLGFDGDRDGAPSTFTKDDVVIAILDTGFDGKHQDLDGGKIIHFLDPDGETEAYDSGSHGTHVASIAAGTGDADAKFRGVAPGAAIVGIKIVSNESDCAIAVGPFGFGCTSSTLDHAIAGYEWIVEHKDEFGIRIATMSFGFGGNTDGTSALELAVDAAWDAGVVCFKSLGNSGPERGTVTIPGAARGILAMGAMLDPAGNTEGQSPSSPVAALGSLRGMALAGFSSRGPTLDGRVKPNLAAPGMSITAAYAGSGNEYATFSGTSMASPFGAGVAALVLDANPALTPDEVRDVLYASAEDWGVEGPDVDYGWGRIRAAEAVSEALRRAGQPATAVSPVVPFHEVRAGRLGDAMPGTLGPLGAGAVAASERTLEVEDTAHPFAVTAIVEGRLLSLQVVAPGGDVVASLAPGPGRQHNVGFVAEATGTYLVRLVGTPQAPFVLDIAHGTAGGIAIDVPTLPGDGLEAANARATPLDGLAVMAALGLAAVLLAARRRGA